MRFASAAAVGFAVLLEAASAAGGEYVAPKPGEALVWVLRPARADGIAGDAEIVEVVGNARLGSIKSLGKVKPGHYRVWKVAPASRNWARADVWKSKKEALRIAPAKGQHVFLLLGPTDKGEYEQKFANGSSGVFPVFKNGFIEIPDEAARQILPELTKQEK